MNSEQMNAATSIPTIPIRYPLRRIRIGIGFTLAGFIVFLVGARPDFFGLDRSGVIGFVQIAVFTIGLGIISIGGYITMLALWKDQHISIAADIGQRLVATGYVVAVFAGMADIFGLGSHLFPIVPYFGVWQARGVLFSEGLIAFGFLLMFPLRAPQRKEGSIPPESDSGNSPMTSNIS